MATRKLRVLVSVQSISPKVVQQARDQILASIADRGSDRSRRLLALLFEDYFAGRQSIPTWRELWEKCWDEPLGSLRGSDVQPSRTVGQAIYRLREILDRYFTSDTGQRFPFTFVIEPNKYQLRVLRKTTEKEELSDSPFIDSQFPES